MPKAKKKYLTKPLNYCIYCHATNVVLTDEHIIPAGLDGISTLPKASCKACEKLTSRFERTVLDKTYSKQRLTQGSFSRNIKNKPTQVSVLINDSEYSILPDEHPSLFILLYFRPPEIESGAYSPDKKVRIAGFDSVVDQNKLERLFRDKVHPTLTAEQKISIQKNGYVYKDSINYVQFGSQSFMQMLAKIALCSAVVKFGKAIQQHNFLRPLVTGNSSHFNYLIGNEGSRFNASISIINNIEPHRVFLAKENGYLICYIQIYHNRFGTRSTYKVYVSNYPSKIDK